MSPQEDGLGIAIRQIPAFSALSDQVLGELIALSRSAEFPAGERLVQQADAGDFAIVLLTGDVVVVNESRLGSEVLAEISAPALLGEIGALAGLKRTASILARSDVSALLVDRDILLRICRHAPEIMQSVVGQLGGLIENMNRALGLYANGLAALEKDEFDPAVLDTLSNPVPQVRNFSTAFRRFARHIAHERRTRDEMSIAALIQRAMLPQNLEALPLRDRCDVFADMKPARVIGGDFYDVFMLDDNRLVIAVGDVCGKGVPASLFMTVTMTTLRLASRADTALLPTLERASTMLYEQNPTMMFATLFYGILDLSSGRLDYAICGHNPPFVRRADGQWQQLASGGTPLGIMPVGRFGLDSIVLAPGEGIFVYTDGITESIDPSGVEYGDAQLAATLGREGGSSCRNLVEAVVADVNRHAAGGEQFDDITCLAVIMK
jgi:phosphoserine phosphatase RsbU/P